MKQLLKNIGKQFFKKRLSYDQLVKNISRFGKELTIGGPVFVTEPRELIAGCRVKIGKGVELYSEGGLVICDDVQIGDKVKIYCNPERKHYSYLQSYGTTQTLIIPPGTNIPDGSVVTPLSLHDFTSQYVKINSNRFTGANLFFVLSTGRSGSNAFANIFSAHEKIKCNHEELFILNRLSTLFAHGEIEQESIREILEAIYQGCSLYDDEEIYFGNSDQKLVNLLPHIHAILPKARFIWLIRNGHDFVSSAYGRGWFDEFEYTFQTTNTFSNDSIVPKSIFDKYRLEYSLFRLSGLGCGEFSEDEWRSMSSFARNCWYWSYWNKLIEAGFEKLIPGNRLTIKLEELNSHATDVLSFIGVKTAEISPGVFNKATYEKHPYSKWTAEQKNEFEKFCGSEMMRWYAQNIS